MTSLKISVLGTGDMGGALTTALRKRTPHNIFVRGSGSASQSARKLRSELSLPEASDEDIATSDMVFVVVPATAIPSVTSELATYSGIIVSVSVSGTVAQDGLPSCAERIATALPKAKVVNAFSSIWSDVIRNPGSGEKTSVFVSSDHQDAAKAVSDLVTAAGFEAINAGKLSSALFAEAMGLFVVKLAVDCGYGRTISFRAFQAR
jgi:predicted dinucleotide-binding enzyme